jgi:hypothetical protein
MNTVNKI